MRKSSTCLLSLLLLLLGSSAVVKAAKDKNKDKDSDDFWVYDEEEEEWYWVTPNPTSGPTDSPTLEPTSEPTNSPTASPSISPAPTTPVPTLAPNSIPVIPIIPPDNDIVVVSMPDMDFDVETTGMLVGAVGGGRRHRRYRRNLGSLYDAPLEESVNTFLRDFFETGTYRNAFANMHGRVRVDQASTESATIQFTEGNATYDSKLGTVPTENDLETILSAYFSFWGDQHFEEHLSYDGFPVTRVEQVKVNGKVLESNRVGGSSGESAGSNDNDSPLTDKDGAADPKNGGTSNAKTAAAVLVIICGIVVIGAMFWWAYKRRVRKRDEREAVVTEDEEKAAAPPEESALEPAVVQVNNSNEKAAKDQEDITSVNQESESVDQESEFVNLESDDDTSTMSGNSPTQQQLVPGPKLSYVEKDDDSFEDSQYSTDGDIVSVTESLLYRTELQGLGGGGQQQGPLFQAGKNNNTNLLPQQPQSPTGSAQSFGSSPPSSMSPVSPQPVEPDEDAFKSGKTSARKPGSGMTYDSSRLDAVISQAKGMA